MRVRTWPQDGGSLLGSGEDQSARLSFCCQGWVALRRRRRCDFYVPQTSAHPGRCEPGIPVTRFRAENPFRRCSSDPHMLGTCLGCCGGLLRLMTVTPPCRKHVGALDPVFVHILHGLPTQSRRPGPYDLGRIFFSAHGSHSLLQGASLFWGSHWRT